MRQALVWEGVMKVKLESPKTGSWPMTSHVIRAGPRFVSARLTLTVRGCPGIAPAAGTSMLAAAERQGWPAREVCAANQAVPAKLRAVSVVDPSVETFQSSHQRS